MFFRSTSFLSLILFVSACGADDSTSQLNADIVPGGNGYNISHETFSGQCLGEAEATMHDKRLGRNTTTVFRVGALKPCITSGKMLTPLFLKTGDTIWPGDDRLALKIFLGRSFTCLADGGAGRLAATSWMNCGLQLENGVKPNGVDWIVQRKGNLLARLVSLAPGATKTAPKRCLEADATKKLILKDCSESSYQWRLGQVPF